MYFAKQIDENGEIVAIHSMSIPFVNTAEFIPISEAKYLELLAEMEQQTTEEILEEEEVCDACMIHYSKDD